MTTDTRVWPDIAIPPGELLAETLDTLGLSQVDLARRAGRPPQAINEIVRGAKEITPETALQLERVLGVPAHVWTRLEADYRHTKARLEDGARLRQELSWADRYPYAAIAKLGWVRRTRDALDRVRELLGFFGVASLELVPEIEAAAFRRSPTAGMSREALAAWLRQGEREAREMTVSPFSATRLRDALPEIRALSCRSPEEFEPQLCRILAETGVAFTIVPHLPATGAHGATRWLSAERALVQMSIRGRWDDVFWFSLFHELGHLLLHRRSVVFIEDGESRDEAEREADRFARDQLIPPAAYQTFLHRANYRTRGAIVAFAREQGIAPSIVVGRLQHDRRVPYSHLNDLRTRFTWVNAAG